MKQKISILCVSLVLFCVTILTLLVGCTSESSEGSNICQHLEAPSARRYYSEAWEMAHRWRTDVELVSIQVDVVAPEQQFPFLPEVFFRFESPSEEQLIFTVTCRDANCRGQEFSVSRTTGFGRIELDEEMIDSTEAATISCEHGGAQYFSQNYSTTYVSFQRDNPRDVGPVVWLGFYSSPEGPFRAIIDPYTGEVVRLEVPEP